MRYTNLRCSPEVSGRRGKRGRGGGVGGDGGGLCLTAPRWILLLVSACLCVSVSVFNGRPKTMLKGGQPWQSLIRFLLGFFLYFFIFSSPRVFLSVSGPWCWCSSGTQGGCSKSTWVRLSGDFQVGYSWLASLLSVSHSDADGRSIRQLGAGLVRPNQGRGVISYLRWRGRWWASVCV